MSRSTRETVWDAPAAEPCVPRQGTFLLELVGVLPSVETVSVGGLQSAEIDVFTERGFYDTTDNTTTCREPFALRFLSVT